jgi:ABC-type transport system involved in multi-copper enzyme maturation permease subunit
VGVVSPSSRARLARLVRAELIKLSTTSLVPVVVVAGALLTAAIVALMASQEGGTGHMAPPPLGTAAGLTQLITAGDLGLILAMVLGAIIASGEYKTTATATFLAAPRRSHVLLAKLAVAAGAGALVAVVAASVATAVGLVWVAVEGYGVAVPAATMVRYAAGAALAGALLAMLGTGLGTLVRRQVVIVVGILIWRLILEEIICGLLSSVDRYQIGDASAALSGQPIDNPLPWWAAAGLLAGVAAVVAIIASRTTLRRDIA